MPSPCSRALGLALVAACGGGGGGDPAIDGGEPDGSTGMVDLSVASWELEPVAMTPGNSIEANLSFTSDGRALIVFREGLADLLGFAVRNGPGDWDLEMVPAPPGGAVFSPAVAGGADGSAHIVYTASTGAGGTDVFYMRWDGGGLSTPVNLTAAGPDGANDDGTPAIIARPDGSVTVFYVNLTPEVFPTDRELRALSFTNPASPGTPETLQARSRDCGQLRARVDGGGFAHLIAMCGADVVYHQDRTGTFVSQDVDPGTTTGLVAPDIAIGPEGEVHVVVQGSAPCGDATCSDPFYSLNLAPGIPVTGATQRYFHPALALDREGVPIVAFHELPGRRLHWTFLTPAGRFFRAQRIDPIGDGEQIACSAATDPGTGLPWIAIENSGETNDIWLARLVP
jgi:hypothetical protein